MEEEDDVSWVGILNSRIRQKIVKIQNILGCQIKLKVINIYLDEMVLMMAILSIIF